MYCLICGIELDGKGILFDGYYFDDTECVNIYCAFMNKEYVPQIEEIAA